MKILEEQELSFLLSKHLIPFARISKPPNSLNNIISIIGLGSGKLRVWESESESVRRKSEKS